MPVPFRLICVLLGYVFGLALGMSEIVGRAQEPVTVNKNEIKTLPDVFQKSDPESIADLKSFETHLKEILPRLQSATVAVRINEAHGSGVIVTPNGLIMTAGHVSGRPGRPAEITLSDGTTVSGRTLGRNRNLDSGLIQIEGGRNDWPFCPRETMVNGKSKTKLGDWCIVLGHPGGYMKGRSAPLRVGRVIMIGQRLVQTDCELVGGDSGGPMFNMNGEVIAINSRIGQPLEFNFHVPTQVYEKEWDQLVKSEDLKGSGGALLGLSGVSDPNGLRVTRVYADEPAERAGVRVGDVIVTFESHTIHDMSQLISEVSELMPGDEVTIELLRDGKPVKVIAELDVRWD
jgi:serine protease Do